MFGKNSIISFDTNIILPSIALITIIKIVLRMDSMEFLGFPSSFDLAQNEFWISKATSYDAATKE